MRPLFISKNLVSHDIVEGLPWNFDITPERVHEMQQLSKDARRAVLFQPTYEWNVYSGFRGLNMSRRVSKTDNPPILCRALVIDYDAFTPHEMVEKAIEKMDPALRPTWVEQSLGIKWRAIWIFEKDILIDSLDHAEEFLQKLIKTLGANTLLAGYDEASCRATQMWTNGGYWIETNDQPLPYNLVEGVAAKLMQDRKSEGFEIPMETIAAEVEKRFPGKWKGDFIEGAYGVRFWDEKADNPRGAFVTKRGCSCFTGLKAFITWEEIFGKVWVESNRAINMGEITKGIYNDGRTYWYETGKGCFMTKCREDIQLSFRVRGLSSKIPKGATSSECDKALDYINTFCRVTGAAPLLYRPPGVVELNGVRILNTAYTPLIEPAKGPCDPSMIPQTWDWWQNRFVDTDNSHPELYWNSHWHRVFDGIYTGQPVTTRAIFLCGPPESGKTMLCERMICPMLGGKMADPHDYMMGHTQFNSDILNSGLLAINDSEAPSGDRERNQWSQKLKSIVVNGIFQFHAKFKEKITIPWNGQVMVTLNSDPKSVAMLPGLEEGTKDKVMFFLMKHCAEGWPNKYEMRKIIDRDLPILIRILLDWKIPDFIATKHSRYGMHSYYNPTLVELSHQQESSYNLQEIIQVWQKEGSYWVGTENKCWEGTATELLTQLSEHSNLLVVLKDWNSYRIAKALNSLASLSTVSGITQIGGSKSRKYRICKL